MARCESNTGAYLLFWSKVVDDVEELPDLLRGLALDHVSHGLAANITKMPGDGDVSGVAAKGRMGTKAGRTAGA